MAPVIPSSLSPHVCIVPSPDLSELLEQSGLPPLPNILQSFSPLPQVTTRTTSLVSVPHSSFALRFSDLAEVEEACREPEEQRALRTLDWISVRIMKRSEKWVQEVEERGEMAGAKPGDRLRSPWWDELRRCAEGDIVPDKDEGWNHPAAVILAVSTMAPNPLQAIAELHARQPRLPPWVDSNYLRYTLVVHPKNSALSDEEATALFNAVKKQYGLHAYLLPLNLPSPPPPPIPVPALMPRLPPPTGPESPQIPRQFNAIPPTPVTANVPAIPSNPYALNTIRLDEKDIQATARFTREFVVMSLIPWMERCVIEWNEAYASTRRLPSRLFSSTRRLFGSPSPSPGPTHSSSSSISTLPGRSSISSISASNSGSGLSQPRRLAEFATILGDFKLAVNLWESLRKESKGGSDILPILSAPSPALQLHASNALLSIHPSADDLPPHAQLRALLHAVRWEIAIDQNDFLSDELEGERWLVWAAGNVEEAPAALLLAHAAFLSSIKKKAYRRAAFWYASAAGRLEKCGIKPLTVYFLRKAQELFETRPPKELSPSFWDSEGKSQFAAAHFVDVKAGVEHPLARLLYTTGNISEAVKMFLGALRALEYPTLQPQRPVGFSEEESERISQDKTFLDDFRVAFAHLAATDPKALQSLNLTLPLRLSRPKETKIRIGDGMLSQSNTLEARESQWTSFLKSQGKNERLVSGSRVCVGDLVWIDLVLSNPLDTDVELANLTLTVECPGLSEAPLETLVETEVVGDVRLSPLEKRTVPVSLRPLQAVNVVISDVKYDFLSILPVKESLASRGRRLHDTPAQRQTKAYAPDVLFKLDVFPADNRLTATFELEGGELVILQGEIRELSVTLKNTGSTAISEAWLVYGNEHELWVGENSSSVDSSSPSEIVHSNNSMGSTDPHRVHLDEPLQTGASTSVNICLHAERSGSHQLCLMVAFRESDSAPYRSVPLVQPFEVRPLLDVSISSSPASSRDHAFVLDVETSSLSLAGALSITQISTISPLWKFESLEVAETTLSTTQNAKFSLTAEQWLDGEGKQQSLHYLVTKLEEVLAGQPPSTLNPPEIDLVCSHAIHVPPRRGSIHSTGLWDLIQAGRRRYTSELVAREHPHIPEGSHSKIFPLYNPTSVDVVVFWEIPSLKRKGHVTVYGVKLGATHGALEDIVLKSENSKVKRSMYAETVREKAELVEAIRGSDWNADMDPTIAIVESKEVEHDFAKGPCHVVVDINIRNYSPLYAARVALKLPGSHQTSSEVGNGLGQAAYSGRLTYRNIVPPGDFTMIQPRILVDRPGLYSVAPFTLETELVADPSQSSKRAYTQQHASPDVCIVVRQSKS